MRDWLLRVGSRKAAWPNKPSVQIACRTAASALAMLLSAPLGAWPSSPPNVSSAKEAPQARWTIWADSLWTRHAILCVERSALQGRKIAPSNTLSEPSHMGRYVSQHTRGTLVFKDGNSVVRTHPRWLSGPRAVFSPTLCKGRALN